MLLIWLQQFNEHITVLNIQAINENNTLKKDAQKKAKPPVGINVKVTKKKSEKKKTAKTENTDPAVGDIIQLSQESLVSSSQDR